MRKIIFLGLGIMLICLGGFFIISGTRNRIYYGNFIKNKEITTAQVIKKIKPLNKFQDTCLIVVLFRTGQGKEFTSELYLPRWHWDHVRTSASLKIAYNTGNPEQVLLPHQLEKRYNPLDFYVKIIGGVLIIFFGAAVCLIFRD
ncbi:MAG: DUF3592 domain-containing protein [bacterium]